MCGAGPEQYHNQHKVIAMKNTGWQASVRLVVLVAMLGIIAACGGPKMTKHPHEVQVELYKAQVERYDAQILEIQKGAASCKGDWCKAMATQSLVMFRMANPPPQVPTYVQETPFWKQLVVEGLRQLPVLGQIYAGDRANARMANLQLQQTESQNAMWGGIVTAVAENSGDRWTIDGG